MCLMVMLMNNSFKFLIIYTIILIAFFIYILLAIFVIPEVGVVVTGSETTNSAVNTNVIASTDTYYQDDNITIKLTTERVDNTSVYIADVVINNIAYLKTAFASNTYGRNITATTSTIASSNNALLAINGDYYGFRTAGFVLRNGTIYRSSSYGNEDLVINSDGSFTIVQENSSDLGALLNNGALQVFSFGPALVENSSLSVTTSSEVAQSMTSNPRTAIGIIDNLHYVFVVSDGRTNASTGLTLYELAEVMQNLGCTTAYNLDGGGSSTMYFNGQVVNNPTDGHTSGERKVSDIIYVGY
jgi:exopolysaccharide biosynthesis protein